MPSSPVLSVHHHQATRRGLDRPLPLYSDGAAALPPRRSPTRTSEAACSDPNEKLPGHSSQSENTEIRRIGSSRFEAMAGRRRRRIEGEQSEQFTGTSEGDGSIGCGGGNGDEFGCRAQHEETITNGGLSEERGDRMDVQTSQIL